MARQLHRRHALQLGAAAGLGYFFTGPSFSVVKAAGSNEKLNFAAIGVGGKGRDDVNQAAQFGDIVALCDIDESEKHLGGAAKKWPKAKTFFDMRKLFDDAELMKTIDAVTVSTPDHMHASAAVPCMRAGKHVFVQKPLTRTVFEARTMMETARKYKVCTQMGNQGTAENGLRRAVELIQDGLIGQVKEVHVWTNRPIWPQAPAVMKRLPKQEIPENVHWDEFLGGSGERPYNKGYHPFAWRGFWAFGTGAIGDMACHTANMAFMALKLGHPTKVMAEAGDVNEETCPSWAHVTMEFPKRDKMDAATLHWYEGKRDGKKVLPPQELIDKVVMSGKKLVDSGSILVGDKGVLYSPDDYGAKFFVTPGELTEGKNLTKPEKLPINGGGESGHKKEWVAAIKANKPALALSNFDYSAMLTEAFLLGNVAIRSGQGFEWDGPAFKVSGNEKALQYLMTEYRKGWDLIGEKA